jgi:crossover junction endodeoxyribonuclease RusA
MSPSTHLTLPYPPSVNSYWRHSRGRHYISHEGKEFRTEVWAETIRQRSGAPPIRGPIQVQVVAQPPDARYRDVDNIQKALFDALKYGRLYVDDHQIISFCATWEAPIERGRVIVEVSAVYPPPAWWVERAAASEVRRQRAARRATSARARP